jgi:DNA-binding PadR family transcriptional regulator
LHGLGIADRIAQVTNGALQIKAGSLFPALYRLEADGLVSGAWGESQLGRRAKLYTLTKEGRKHLADEKKSWARAALAVKQVLEM